MSSSSARLMKDMLVGFWGLVFRESDRAMLHSRIAFLKKARLLGFGVRGLGFRVWGLEFRV